MMSRTAEMVTPSADAEPKVPSMSQYMISGSHTSLHFRSDPVIQRTCWSYPPTRSYTHGMSRPHRYVYNRGEQMCPCGHHELDITPSVQLVGRKLGEIEGWLLVVVVWTTHIVGCGWSKMIRRGNIREKPISDG
ncbi:hypothetical protein EVAR_12738_1 [Eumeta japonica]|uniref:Uncharacterized protein n=1 Tax=Eumeta variegata TaxID=151549 RepID=A0A4C1UP05_EUMVA|nr:hypothetical protein EVAR_12738_1 [Eumeta japonica]